MNYLIIINDPPYGTERLYNGLRLAHSLQGRQHSTVIFLLGDAVLSAKTGQKTPDGFYNSERMLRRVAKEGRVLLCGTCMDARGISTEETIEGAERSSMESLAEQVEKADQVIVF